MWDAKANHPIEMIQKKKRWRYYCTKSHWNKTFSGVMFCAGCENGRPCDSQSQRRPVRRCDGRLQSDVFLDIQTQSWQSDWRSGRQCGSVLCQRLQQRPSKHHCHRQFWVNRLNIKHLLCWACSCIILSSISFFRMMAPPSLLNGSGSNGTAGGDDALNIRCDFSHGDPESDPDTTPRNKLAPIVV